MSGNDADAKGQVKAIFEKAGFAMVDLGALAIGGRLQQFPGGPLPTLKISSRSTELDMRPILAMLALALCAPAQGQERSAAVKDVALWYQAFDRNDPALLDRS